VAAVTQAHEVALSHYTAEPLMFEPDRRYGNLEYPAPKMMKPIGFWLSADGEDDWPEWCTDNGWRIRGLEWRTPFRVREGARVKFMQTYEELIEFTQTFCFPPDPKSQWKMTYIDWHEVIFAGWQGVLVAPYCWRARMDDKTSWYYGWDCASGVFWDLEAIEQIGPSERFDAKVEARRA